MNPAGASYPLVDGTVIIPWASMSVFLIEMRVNGRILSRGTCVAVARDDRWFIVTNRHNVTGRDQYDGRCLSPTGGLPDEVVVVLPAGRLGDDWYGHAIALFDADEGPRWTEHPEHGARVDVVALPFDRPAAARCFGMSLDDRNDFAVRPGDPVNVIGYRDALPAFAAFAQWVDGTLESPLSGGWNDLPAFLIRGETRSGLSGSPVIAIREPAFDLRRSDGSAIGSNWAERFLGIYSGRTRDGAGVVWNLDCVRAVVDAAP